MKPLGLALAAAVLAALPATAAAQGPPPPPNDHYFESLRVVPAGEPLPRDVTIRDIKDTTSATEQSDMLSPGPGGGPPEPTNCEGTPFGKTIWYDIYPDRAVVARVTVNANGFDPVIGIVRFNPENAQPIAGTCINRLAFVNEVLEIPLERGGAYSVQVGGANSTGGQVETLFDFFRPPVVEATPQLVARGTPNGIRVTRFSVEAERGARVEVRCPRGGCRRQVRTAATASGTAWGPIGDNATMSSRASRPRAHAARVVTFRGLRNRAFRRGQTIELRVTQPGFIGRYVKYTVRPGAVRRTQGCLEPGSRTPRRRCG